MTRCFWKVWKVEVFWANLRLDHSGKKTICGLEGFFARYVCLTMYIEKYILHIHYTSIFVASINFSGEKFQVGEAKILNFTVHNLLSRHKK